MSTSVVSTNKLVKVSSMLKCITCITYYLQIYLLLDKYTLMNLSSFALESMENRSSKRLLRFSVLTLKPAGGTTQPLTESDKSRNII